MCQPGHRFYLEAVHQRIDGTVFPIELSANVLRSENRNVILTVIQDTTQRKRAEEERKRTMVGRDRLISCIEQSGFYIYLAVMMIRF